MLRFSLRLYLFHGSLSSGVGTRLFLPPAHSDFFGWWRGSHFRMIDCGPNLRRDLQARVLPCVPYCRAARVGASASQNSSPTPSGGSISIGFPSFLRAISV